MRTKRQFRSTCHNSRQIYERAKVTDSHAIIKLETLRKNLELLKGFAGLPALPAIKANAYGHGAVRVAQHLEKDVMGFAVATPHEALELRVAGISADIVLLTPAPPEKLENLIHNKISFVISSVDQVQTISRFGDNTKVHLKLNTGLNRLGARESDAAKILLEVGRSKLVLEGVMTHLVDSEDLEPEHAVEQIEMLVRFLETHKPDARFFHAANTGGILNQSLHREIFNLIRPGIGLYGYAPGEDMHGALPLEPAMTVQAWVTMTKRVFPGEIASYNAKWTATTETNLATVRFGYADGYPRAASGQAQVEILGQVFPVVGRICMDQILVDVGDLEIPVGTPVTIFGNSSITAESVAGWAGTNAYEILTSVGNRLERVYQT
jgi:alanine racemase